MATSQWLCAGKIHFHQTSKKGYNDRDVILCLFSNDVNDKLLYVYIIALKHSCISWSYSLIKKYM